MAEYSDTIAVTAAPDAVFAFVSDIANLPKYLPTVHSAAKQQGERVEVEGEANGHKYDSDGWFKVDAANRTMTWGSDGENDYSGKMAVSGSGTASEVTCTLRYSPKPDVAKAMEDHQGGPAAAMKDGLKTSLASIKNLLEGHGGKQHSSAER